MGFLESMKSHSSSGGVCGAITRLILRFLQFVLALTVAGLYGVDLHHGTEAGIHPDSKWVYAEVVAGLSALTCFIYGVPFFKSYWAFGWDFILFLLWTVLFGIFGKIYIPAHPTPKQDGVIRMKHAVWVDLACMLLWFITAAYSTLIWFRGRKESRTGSSKV